MWKQFLDAFVKVISYVQRTKALEQNVSAQEAELKKMGAIVQQLIFALQRTNDKVDNISSNEGLEREKLLLKVENQLLKSGRQLPPASDDQEKQ